MELLVTWPKDHASISLPESFTSEMKMAFDASTGDFLDQPDVHSAEGCVFFYWTLAGPAIINTSGDYVCIIDEVHLEENETRMLRVDSEIQIGHYLIQTVMGENMSSPEDMFYSLNGNGREKSSVIIPEIEEILPRGAHYIGDLNYSNEIASKKSTEMDAIKTLELEYKSFLIWGDLNNDIYNNEEKKSHNSINDDVFFDSARSDMKSKTLTECVLAAPSLIDKVWSELDVVELEDDIFYEESNHEILMLLAPEKFIAKNKKIIPELAYQDLYKIGLDSNY